MSKNVEFEKRNFELEKRIKERRETDVRLGRNSYGGMGMDSISGNYKKMILEELEYIDLHPEIYRNTTFPTNKNMYMINLG